MNSSLYKVFAIAAIWTLAVLAIASTYAAHPYFAAGLALLAVLATGYVFLPRE